MAVVLCLLVWWLAGVLMAQDHRQSLDAEIARNNNLVLAQEQAVARSLAWLQTLLRVVQRERRALGRVSDMDGLVNDLGTDRAHINNLVLIDARGNVVQALRPGVANVADRAYFQRHRDDVADDFLLGPAVKGKISGRWSLTLSRRLVDAQGRFDGVVLLSVQPDLFAGQFLSSALRQTDSVGLVGLDGEVRVRREGNAVGFGGQAQSPLLFDALKLAPQGHFQGAWNQGLKPQLVSYRTVPSAAMVVVLASSLDDALAPAHTRATVVLALAGLANLLFGTLAAMVLRTRRRQFEATQRVAHNEARYRWLFEHMLDGVLGLDEQGAIRAVNPAACELLGRPQHELLGSVLWQYQVDGHPDRVAWQDSLRRTGRAREVCRLLRQDGQAFDAELSSALPLDAPPDQGAAALITVVLRDISSRRQAEEAQRRQALAEQASEAKNSFMSRMSHELRTPLNAILGFAQLLERDPRAPLAPHQLEQVQHVLRAGRHLLALINEVLDLSQVEGGRLRLHIESVDLRVLAREVLGALADEAAQAQIHLIDLEPEQAADAPPVLADPVRLRQVLYNLVGNAIKYGRTGGWVRLDLRVFEQTCRLEVCDNGLGMRPDQVSALFQPFNRLGREQSKLPGTGIGLVISRRLVELMQGVLTVHSEAEVGSVFGVELPRAADGPTVPSGLAPDRGLPAPSQPLPVAAARRPGASAIPARVLLVEDDLANQAVVRGCLASRPGVALVVAGSAAQARALAAVRLPDLALIDMMLPDGSGLEVMRSLRALAGPRGLRCVAVSANAMPAQVDAALRAGFDAYLTKPVQFDLLLAEVDRSLPAAL
jgi:PAS domain S-box-containing protein